MAGVTLLYTEVGRDWWDINAVGSYCKKRLSWTCATDDTGLREAFGKYGEVVEARVVVDRETGRSKGFGFVTYATPDDASSAIQALDGQDLHGRMSQNVGVTSVGGGYDEVVEGWDLVAMQAAATLLMQRVS
ncbi:hypothetical protein LguiA_026435 [Lonicera macranthoides]